MQPLLILFGAGLTLAASFGFGSALLRRECGDPGVRMVAGAAPLSLAVFACCAMGAAYPLVLLLLALAGLACGWRYGRGLKWQLPIDRRWYLLAAPFLLLYLSVAMAPEISYDGSRYHLGLVARYLRERGFHPILDNFYAALSQGVEMLYLLAFAFGRHSAAALVHLGFLLALCWQMVVWGRSAGFPLAGIAGALLVFLSPLAGVDGSSAYNDVAVAAIAFTLFHLLDMWDQRRSRRLLAVAGLVAGFACAAKYTAFLAVPYAVAFVAWKSRSRRDLAVVAGCAALVLLPWMSKDLIYFHDPVAPFLNYWFPNRLVTESFEATYKLQMAHPANLAGIQAIPLQVTTYGSLSGLLGPVFLLAPISLLALRLRQGRQLLLAAAVFGLPFFANVNARFLLPALPFVALAMGLALEAAPRLAVGVLALHALLAWPPVLRLYSRPDAWHLNKVTWREALRIKPEDGFLESNLPLYGAARLVERATPAGAVVFVQTPIPEAYTSRVIRTSFQSAGNAVSREILWSGFAPDYAPTRRYRFRFRARALRGVRVVQASAADGVWSIHEIRAFLGAAELPRERWRATAQPYPWGIEAVTDGRPASLWECGQNLRAGQLVTVDFGAAALVDTVLIEAAPHQPAPVLRLEDAAAPVLLSSAPEVLDVPPPPDLRRQAAEELRRRGIDYVLLFDGEFGAADLRGHAADWGVRPAGEYKGARLYQLP